MGASMTGEPRRHEALSAGHEGRGQHSRLQGANQGRKSLTTIVPLPSTSLGDDVGEDVQAFGWFGSTLVGGSGVVAYRSVVARRSGGGGGEHPRGTRSTLR